MLYWQLLKELNGNIIKYCIFYFIDLNIFVKDWKFVFVDGFKFIEKFIGLEFGIIYYFEMQVCIKKGWGCYLKRKEVVMLIKSLKIEFLVVIGLLCRIQK